MDTDKSNNPSSKIAEIAPTPAAKRLTLRIRCEKNTNQVIRDVSEDESLAAFYNRISVLTGIPRSNIVLLAGFPPKRLKLDFQKSVKSLGLCSQDTLIVEHGKTEDFNVPDLSPHSPSKTEEHNDIKVLETKPSVTLYKEDSSTNVRSTNSTTVTTTSNYTPGTSTNSNTRPVTTSAKTTNSTAPSNGANKRTKPISSNSAVPKEKRTTNTNTSQQQPEGEQPIDIVDLEPPPQELTGILLRHVVPSDNSCMFSAVIFGLTGSFEPDAISAGGIDVSQLRKIIADAVRSNPEQYNLVFLGRSNEDYQKWIRNSQSWGGAIELAILSDFYKVQIAVMNIQGQSISVFGEAMDYQNRIYLIYDGIHYDSLYLEPFNGLPPTAMFSKDDEDIYTQAMELGREAFNSKQFTNVNDFTLMCSDCHEVLAGQVAAKEHGEKTGHVRFEEKNPQPV